MWRDWTHLFASGTQTPCPQLPAHWTLLLPWTHCAPSWFQVSAHAVPSDWDPQFFSLVSYLSGKHLLIKAWLKHHLLKIPWLLAHSSLSTPRVLFFFTIRGIIMCIFMYYLVPVTRMTAHGRRALPCSPLYWIYLALSTIPGPESASINIARCKRKEWMSEDLADAVGMWKNSKSSGKRAFHSDEFIRRCFLQGWMPSSSGVC